LCTTTNNEGALTYTPKTDPFSIGVLPDNKERRKGELVWQNWAGA